MNTVKEKKNVKIFKLLAILFFIASVVFAIVTTLTGVVEIKDYDGSYYYNSSTNQSTCAITIEFETPAVGDFTLSLYDANKNLIYEKDYEITEHTTKFVVNFVVTGEADSFEINDYYFSTSSSTLTLSTLSYILCVVAGICLTLSMRMRCNSYFFNGSRIVVYVGLTKCYLKVNDIVYDEQKPAGRAGVTLFTSLENGDRVLATVTRNNKINLTVNDIYCPPER